MTHKCIFQALPSPLSSRLFYPISCFMSLYVHKHLKVNGPQMQLSILLPQRPVPSSHRSKWSYGSSRCFVQCKSHHLRFLLVSFLTNPSSKPVGLICNIRVNLKFIHFPPCSSAGPSFKPTPVSSSLLQQPVDWLISLCTLLPKRTKPENAHSLLKTLQWLPMTPA